LKNKIWDIISGKKSIRVQILWAFFLSFFGSILLVMVVEIVDTNFSNYVFVPAFLSLFALFTRHIIRYLSTLTDGLQMISGGNLNYRLPILRQDELGNVAYHINLMAEQLQKQMERERELEQSKMELITYVSHDLRTPLTSIIGYLDLLRTHTFEDTKEQERYIDNAFNKTQQLKKLIDDLFEYTRLTHHDVRLTYQKIDIYSLLQQMISELEPVAKEQGITFDLTTNSSSTLIQIDVEKMVRAIDNLLINAVKFSFKPGEVRVNVLVKDNRINLSVANQGKPITQEQAELLFERFYQTEKSKNDHTMPYGYGLGLSIAKQIVELHKGRIWLEHRNGDYKFCMELPHHKIEEVQTNEDNIS
jgi:signal transduction histidine kinase